MNKINWENVYQSFHPAYICRRYKVETNDWCYGQNKYFWFLRSANQHFESALLSKEYPFISLRDTWTNIVLRSYRDQNTKPPVRYV